MSSNTASSRERQRLAREPDCLLRKVRIFSKSLLALPEWKMANPGLASVLCSEANDLSLGHFTDVFLTMLKTRSSSSSEVEASVEDESEERGEGETCDEGRAEGVGGMAGAVREEGACGPGVSVGTARQSFETSAEGGGGTAELAAASTIGGGTPEELVVCSDNLVASVSTSFPIRVLTI